MLQNRNTNKDQGSPRKEIAFPFPSNSEGDREKRVLGNIKIATVPQAEENCIAQGQPHTGERDTVKKTDLIKDQGSQKPE